MIDNHFHDFMTSPRYFATLDTHTVERLLQFAYREHGNLLCGEGDVSKIDHIFLKRTDFQRFLCIHAFIKPALFDRNTDSELNHVNWSLLFQTDILVSIFHRLS